MEIRVTIPKVLHRRLVEQAQLEGVSVETLVLYTLSCQAGLEDGFDACRHRVAAELGKRVAGVTKEPGEERKG